MQESTCVGIVSIKLQALRNACNFIKKRPGKFAKFLRTPYRSSHWSCYVWKGVLRNFAKFTGKHQCKSLIFNKVAGLSHRYFPVNLTKFLRKPFLQNSSGWLFLTLFYWPSPVAASDSFRFPACKFIKK